jgi:hypothetical protein
MSLRVMILFGFLVLVLGCMMDWLAPVTTSQTRLVKPIGTNAVSHGGGSSAGQPRSPIDRADSLGSREELNTQKR